jgi:hypothetical protein
MLTRCGLGFLVGFVFNFRVTGLDFFVRQGLLSGLFFVLFFFFCLLSYIFFSFVCVL